MGKERDITAFFGAPRAASKAVKADQAVEETDTSTKRSVKDTEGRLGGRLKRLKQSSNANMPAAEQQTDAPCLDDVVDEVPVPVAAAAAGPDSSAAAAAAAAGAGAGAGATAGTASKVSASEASAAFKQIFSGGAKKQQQQQTRVGGTQSPAAERRQPAAVAQTAAGAAAAAVAQTAAATDTDSLQEQEKRGKAADTCGGAADEHRARDNGGALDGVSDESDDDDDDDDDDGDVCSDEGLEDGEPAAPKHTKAVAAAAKRPAKLKAASSSAAKVEGVGAGAVAAAEQALGVDVTAQVTWKAGTPVPYSFLVDTFQAIAATTKRLEIIGVLTSAFRAILAAQPADLLPAVYLCTNRVAPAHAGVELGVGDATLIKALAAATGRKEAALRAEYEACGDLGSVAAECRSRQRTMFTPPPLTVAGVLKSFRDIASASGASSQERKKGLIGKLLVASSGAEPGYIIRSLQAKLRIGLAEQSVLVALAHAALLHREGASNRDGRLADRLETAAQVVKTAYSECPSYDRLVPALIDHPLSELPAHCHFTPGVPVKPMLAKPTNGVAEVLDKFSDTSFTCEYKYDGERVQLHITQSGASLRIYSRNAEDMTPRYPDIAARLRGWLAPGVESLVVDGEAVAWDPASGRILPFQVLSTRARKEVALAEVKVQVMVYAFDCLYLNGASLLREPLTARREALTSALVEVPGQLALATAKISTDVEELEAFLDEAVAASTEGLIVKTLADGYEPSRRSAHWLKLKKDYMNGVGDTFDVVPIGAFHGRGKRAGVYGAYLLAVYDDESEAYQTISKLGTGFSEEALAALASALRPHVIPAPRPYYQYGETGQPDVWFEPCQVWEVKAADLSISPVHQAARGLVEAGRGISIRFPRLVRVREDKAPEDATTASQVADMYRQQAVVAAQRGAGGGDAEGGDEY